MEVDDLLVHLCCEAIVDEQRDCNTDHERIVAREYIPDQHCDNADRKQNIEQEQLRTSQLAVSCSSGSCIFFFNNFAFFLSQLAVQTSTACLFLDTGEVCMNQSEENTEDLNRQNCLPEASCFHSEDGSCTHCRTGPGHQVQDTHCENRDSQQACLTHMHASEYRQHRRNNDTECGCAAAVEMSDQSDNAGDDAYTDDIVTDKCHQLADDNVEHAGVCHDTEVKNREDEQGSCRSCAVEAGLDHCGEAVKRETAANDKDQSQDCRPYDERDGRLGLAFEECYDDRNNRKQAENTNYC